MVKKVEKVVKFSQGDILFCTSSNCNVELLSRWDIKPHQRTAWLVRRFPDPSNDFAVPESELRDIENT